MNTKQIGVTLLDTVREWVEPAFKAVFDRLDAFEQRLQQIPPGPPGIPGKDGASVDPDAVAALVIERLPKPKDGEQGIPGKDAEPLNLAWAEKLIRSEIQVQFAVLPRPKDGDPGKPGAPGSPGSPGKDGESVDRAELAASIEGSIALQFTEMANELMLGLEEEAQVAPTVVNIGTDAKAPASSGVSPREQTVIGKMIANTIRDTLMLPVKPVYDDQGRLLYGQRVAPDEAV